MKGLWGVRHVALIEVTFACNSLVIPFFTVPCSALHSRICLSRHACCMYARPPIRAAGAQVLRCTTGAGQLD